MMFSLMRIVLSTCTSILLVKVLAMPAATLDDGLERRPSYDYGIASSKLVERQDSQLYSSSGVITGVLPGTDPNGPVPLRPNILDLERDSDMWTLYMLGLDLMQYTDQSQLLSWYQVSGIHGRPYLPWNGVEATSGDQNTGYCTHVDILFPVWHRPYLALYEQALYDLIQQIASFWPAGEEQDTMVAAAQTFRIPYWDWAAAPPAGRSIFPECLWNSSSVTVDGPAGVQTIANPLFDFQFKPLNNTQLPDAPLSRWSSTMRYPSTQWENATSQNNLVASQLDNSAASFRARLFNLFTNYPNYQTFSNEAWIPKDKDSTDGYDSLESIHDQIHGLTGSGGHMSYIEYSGFDPVFWLHHAMIDRVFTMWQVLYPNSYVDPEPSEYGTFTTSPGQIENMTSPLTPFHSDENGAFWTPTTARYTTNFGYAYSETANNTDTAQIQQRVIQAINELYGPTAPAVALNSRQSRQFREEPEKDLVTRSGPRNSSPRIHGTASTDPTSQYREWIANMRVQKHALAGPFFIHIFIGNFSADDPFQWSFDPNAVGTHSIFAPAAPRPCTAACESARQVTGTIPLTARLATDVRAGKLRSLDVGDVRAYLREQMSWRVSLPNDTAVASRDVPSLVIEVVSTLAQPATSVREFPRWGPRLSVQLNGTADGGFAVVTR